jgi:hypothetical protein
MTKAERKSYVSRRADELASSGRFRNWLDVEIELRLVEGYEEAQQWLDNRYKRDWLDKLCAASSKTASSNA